MNILNTKKMKLNLLIKIIVILTFITKFLTSIHWTLPNIEDDILILMTVDHSPC